MALQYYKTQQNGNYVVDTTTNKATKIDTIPAGAEGSTVTWNAAGYPPQLQTAINNTAVVATPPSSTTSNTTQTASPPTSTSTSSGYSAPANGYIAPGSVPPPGQPGWIYQSYSTNQGTSYHVYPSGNDVSKDVFDAYQAAQSLSQGGGGYLPGTGPAAQTAPAGQYTFQPLASGNVEILENGKPISNGTGFSPTYAASLGYKAGTTTTPPTQPNTPGTSSGLSYDPTWAKYGITPDIFSQANATQQAQIATAMAAAKSLYSSTGSKVTLDQALTLAATDPNIIAKYADAAKLDTQAFQESMKQLQTATSTTAQNQQTQFKNERKQLAEAQAAAGTAYSGFRGEAQKQLAESEQGIVTSTRAQLQKNVQDLTTQFESKYGTGASTPATTSYQDPFASSNISLSGQYNPTTTPSSTLSGTLAGGITGSEPIAKQQDIQSTASNYVTLGQTPNVIQP